MTNETKILELKTKLFKLISTSEITFLKDLDLKINVIKRGKFFYSCNNCYDQLEHSNVGNFLFQLHKEKFYTLIPLLSVNNKMDEPYIILSKQILITRHSNSLNLYNYIQNKIYDSFYFYNIDELNNFNIVFKYKEVDLRINLNEFK
jgi:hypothetical protein